MADFVKGAYDWVPLESLGAGVSDTACPWAPFPDKTLVRNNAYTPFTVVVALAKTARLVDEDDTVAALAAPCVLGPNSTR